MARTKKGDESAPKNSADASQVEEIIGGIEEQHEGLLKLRMDYMRDCQPFHKRIKDIIDEAVTNFGLSRRALKGKVKQRELLWKAEEIRAKLDSEEAEAFDKLSDQLGDLGAAAKEGFQSKRGPLAGFAAA